MPTVVTIEHHCTRCSAEKTFQHIMFTGTNNKSLALVPQRFSDSFGKWRLTKHLAVVCGVCYDQYYKDEEFNEWSDE